MRTNLIGLYGGGTLSDFTKPFQENEDLYNQAKIYWNHLNDNMIYVIIVTIVLGIGLAWWYFVPLNNQTGRHYTRKWWFGVLLATFISTAIVTGVLLCLQANSSLSGASELRFKITLVSAFYASALYLFVSVIWWNFLPTNACRFMKFK